MKLLIALGFFALSFVCLHGRASATICTQPNALTNGAYVDANGLNTNFQALVTCGNAIDNTNIGSAGIFASQIIPLTIAEAVFGGTQTYAMASLNLTSYLTVTGHNVPYDAQSTGQPNEHTERTNGPIIDIGGGGGLYAVNFTTPFTTSTSFSCQLTPSSYAGDNPTSGGGMIIKSLTGTGPITGLTIVNNWNVALNAYMLCEGY